jgi:flavin reductase (DIM6/NTAB) family NADH-FMN oxidoreductase RutF
MIDAAVEALNPRLFRRVAGHFATGVTVLATQAEADVHGMTANAFMSLSLDPMLVVVGLGRATRLAEHLQAARGFSVNVLRAEQEPLSDYFSTRWSGPPPCFRFVPWGPYARLEGCSASLGCALEAQIPGGDHWLVIGRVTALHLGVEPRLPLLFHAGGYGRLESGVQAPAPPLDGTAAPVQAYYEDWCQG